MGAILHRQEIMRLSKNLTLAEVTATSTGLPNEPNEAQLANLQRLALDVFQPIRERVGIPIRVNSGFRSEAVNRRVGGSRRSAHMHGLALDLTCADNVALFNAAIALPVFDQVIWYDVEGVHGGPPRFVHVGLAPTGTTHRRQVLRFRGGKLVAIMQRGAWSNLKTRAGDE